MLRRWDDPINPPWDGGAFWDEDVVEAGNKRKRVKIKLSLRTLTPDELVALATAIKTALTGNAKFPSPNPALVAFAALITALINAINAYNASLDATATALANRNAAVEALRTALTQLMAYVESLAVTEAEWKYAGSSTKSSGTLKAVRRGRFGCAGPPMTPTTSRAHRAIRRRIWCAERAVS